MSVYSLHVVSLGKATDSPPCAEEPVLQINLGLSYEIIPREEIIIEDLHPQLTLQGKGTIQLKHLSKCRTQVLGHIVLPVLHLEPAELEGQIGITQPIGILGLQLEGLHDVDSDQNLNKLVAWDVLEHSWRRVTTISRQGIYPECTLKEEWGYSLIGGTIS